MINFPFFSLLPYHYVTDLHQSLSLLPLPQTIHPRLFYYKSITTELLTVDDLSTLRIMHHVSDQSRQKISLISGPSEINFTSSKYIYSPSIGRHAIIPSDWRMRPLMHGSFCWHFVWNRSTALHIPHVIQVSSTDIWINETKMLQYPRYS